MIIACATDRNYAELAAVLVNSIALYGDVPEARIVICDFDLRERDRARIRASAMGRQIDFLRLDEEARRRVSRFRRTVSWSRAIYCRLLLPDTVDATGRLLYLDSDMIVRESLRPLFALPLDGCAVGAVCDAEILRHNRRFNRPEGTPYLNSGTLLIDLDEWRRQQIGQKCLDYLESTTEGYPDQDALNIALGQRWVQIDRKWNFTEEKSANLPREHYEQAAILHYTWRKPNLAHCQHPAKDMYLALRQNTPWSDKPLVSDTRRRFRRERKKLELIIERWMRRIAPGA